MVIYIVSIIGSSYISRFELLPYALHVYIVFAVTRVTYVNKDLQGYGDR